MTHPTPWQIQAANAQACVEFAQDATNRLVRDRNRAFAELYDDGIPIAQIADLVGLDRVTVWRAIQAARA